MFIYFGFLAKIVDVKNAFLYRDLEEEVYLEYPQVVSDIRKADCIILDNCICGLVQGARQCYKKANEILKKDFCYVYPCLYV